MSILYSGELDYKMLILLKRHLSGQHNLNLPELPIRRKHLLKPHINNHLPNRLPQILQFPLLHTLPLQLLFMPHLRHFLLSLLHRLLPQLIVIMFTMQHNSQLFDLLKIRLISCMHVLRIGILFNGNRMQRMPE